jgi:aerobic-type carbon monoxide dehydrogenase small subunit (CoxS/CutS family)
MNFRRVSFNVNGRAVTLEVEPRESLADALREELGLTGTHLGCEHGVCGACTVLLNGEAIRGCLMLAVQAEGLHVTTIEGVSPASGLNAIQEAMHRHHALQCGFCTPGMVLALHALFDREPSPDEAQIREAISGNLCRCTGYQPIVTAALDVAGQAGATEGAFTSKANRS